MSIRSYWRSGVVVGFAALAAACSSSGPDVVHGTSSVAQVTSECERNRRSCIYEGRYEPDERNYAELEARRLNQAQLKRMRRW